MDKTSPSEERLVITTRTAMDFTVSYPRRTFLHIEPIHWQRLQRRVSQISKFETLYRDVAWASVGVGVTTLLTAGTVVPMSAAGLPAWVPTLYWCVAIGAFIIFVLCLKFDGKIRSDISDRVSDIQYDMKEIRLHSAVSEEALSEEKAGAAKVLPEIGQPALPKQPKKK